MAKSWLEHVREFRALFPGMSWRTALEKAKDTYERPVAAVKDSVPTERKRNEWMLHVKQFRVDHPGLSYKECLKQAKETYRDTKKNTLEIPNDNDQSTTFHIDLPTDVVQPQSGN